MNVIKAKKLIIYTTASAQWQGRPLHKAIVEHCRKYGIAGATVIHCIEGFGSHNILRTDRLLSLSDNLPLRIEIVETVDRFDEMLVLLDGMLEQGLVISEDVNILKK